MSRTMIFASNPCSASPVGARASWKTGSPPGAIRLSASIEAGDCCFLIRDQGAGIPDYALPHLFERFYGLPRPDGSKGSGLGLAIAQEVARLHGGSVTLANHSEGGVEVCLRVAGN